MKTAYPTVLTPLPEEGGYMVTVPDLEIITQGESVPDAIKMARDAIGLMIIEMEDEKEEIPQPSDARKMNTAKDDILTMVDVDVDAYRRANERRTVRRNVTLPCWMDSAAKEAGINVSAVLQSALMEALGVQ